MTSYEVIYENFLQKITDFKIAQLDEATATLMIHGWMTSAIAKFRTCQSNLSDRDDAIEVEIGTDENGDPIYSVGAFNDDLTDLEIEILGILMVSEWLTPQLNSVLLTKQMITGKDEKSYSQSNHLKELIELKSVSDREARQLLNRYRLVNNNYLTEE